MQGSEALEGLVFKDRLGKTEVAALRQRAFEYQQLHQNEWNSKIFKAYSQYFGFLTALKVRSVLEEMLQENLLSSYPEGLDLWDIGAGALGATLGATDFFKERVTKIHQVHAIDLDTKPTQWAAREFTEFLPPISITQHWNIERSERPQLYILCDVLNETSMDQGEELVGHIARLLSSLRPSDRLIIIEPATKVINQRLLAYRDTLLSEPSRKYRLLLPCTHEKPCPAREQREWCHEEREFRAPQAFWTLVQHLGFERRSLVFSQLVFGGEEAKFKPLDARVVSRNLKSKGKVEKWLCADGKRWKARLLKRHKNEETAETYEAPRGTILDCHSTGLLPPE